MSDPRVEDIRARVVGSPFSEPSWGDVVLLLTKLDEAEKANPPVEVGSPDGSQVYEIPLTEYLETLNASQIFRATQAEAERDVLQWRIDSVLALTGDIGPEARRILSGTDTAERTSHE